MNIPQPSDPVEPIAQAVPTEQDALVFFLVNIFRHSAAAARRAVEAQEEDEKNL